MQHEKSFATLQRLYEDKAKVHLSRSSFYDRFTPELVKFIHACVLHGMENIMQTPNIKLKDKLASFKDHLTQDSTVTDPEPEVRKASRGCSGFCTIYCYPGF